MDMDLMTIVSYMMGMLASIPVIGAFLAKVMPYLAAIPVAVSAFVAVWHAIVLALKAVAMIPGLSKMGAVAEMLAAKEEKITSFQNGTLLPVLNRLSAVPIPKMAPPAQK